MCGMTNIRPVETWLTDMDGVLVHEEVPIPGAQEFIDTLKSSGLNFLVLTNNSIFTPRDLRARLLGSGIDVPEEAIWTSALATAQFLDVFRRYHEAVWPWPWVLLALGAAAVVAALRGRPHAGRAVAAGRTTATARCGCAGMIVRPRLSVPAEFCTGDDRA